MVLRHERWNDFGKRLLYRAWFVAPGKEPIEVGHVKILLDTSGDTRKLEECFERLPEGYASVWQSPRAYERLRELRIYDQVCAALRDIATGDTSHIPDDDLRHRLLRFPCAKLVMPSAPKIPYGGLRLSIVFDGFDAPHDLDLTFGTGLRRMAVLVGENGVGKSRLLTSLVKLVSGEVFSADYLDGVTQLPKFWANFPGGVFAIAYSAFDPFHKRPNMRAAHDGFRIYLGLRSGNDLNESAAIEQAVRAVRSLGDSSEMQRRWRAAVAFCKGLADDLPSLEPWLDTKGFQAALKKTSSGRQVALMVLTGLVAYLQPGQLVLMDEPETHLHPGLLSSMLTVMQQLLTERNAFAMLATHSLIPVQAVVRQQVRIIRLEGTFPSVSEPEFATFGQNLSNLMGYVYDHAPSERLFGQALKYAWDQGRGADQVEEDLEDPTIAATLILEGLRNVES